MFKFESFSPCCTFMKHIYIYILQYQKIRNSQLVSCLPIQKNNILVSGSISEIKVLQWCKIFLSSCTLNNTDHLEDKLNKCRSTSEKSQLNTIKTTHPSSTQPLHQTSQNFWICHMFVVCHIASCSPLVLLPTGPMRSSMKKPRWASRDRIPPEQHENTARAFPELFLLNRPLWRNPNATVVSRCSVQWEETKKGKGGHKIASHLQAPKPCACLQAPMLIELADVHVHMP